jgi:hypothetical protein
MLQAIGDEESTVRHRLLSCLICSRAAIAGLAIIFLAGNAFAGDVSAGSTAIGSDAGPQRAEPIKIAVFGFELEDMSAAGTAVAGAAETKYLAEATEEAKRLLAESGRYEIVSTAGADLGAVQGRGLRNCQGCDVAIAAKLGADQDMIGVVTRISQTEYTITVQISETRKRSVINTFTTNLRMGASYSWARGVTWLMKNRVLLSVEQ